MTLLYVCLVLWVAFVVIYTAASSGAWALSLTGAALVVGAVAQFLLLLAVARVIPERVAFVVSLSAGLLFLKTLWDSERS